jgi:hypothetical protein
VNRPDVKMLKAVVIEADPGAFVVIDHGHQATGGVFRHALRRDRTTMKRPTRVKPHSGEEKTDR